MGDDAVGGCAGDSGVVGDSGGGEAPSGQTGLSTFTDSFLQQDSDTRRCLSRKITPI